jgi:hypothetical protein
VDASILHDELIERVFIGRAFQILRRRLRGTGRVLVYRLPPKSNFEALRHAIVSETLDTPIVDGMVRKW